MQSTVIDMDVYFNEMISNEKLCPRQEELKESQISTIRTRKIPYISWQIIIQLFILCTSKSIMEDIEYTQLL